MQDKNARQNAPQKLDLDLDLDLDLGRTVQTAAVAHWSAEDPLRSIFALACLTRHRSGDWGELDDFDWQQNDLAVTEQPAQRVLSSFPIPETLQGRSRSDKLWIITEWDRSATTVLFPADY